MTDASKLCKSKQNMKQCNRQVKKLKMHSLKYNDKVNKHENIHLNIFGEQFYGLIFLLEDWKFFYQKGNFYHG